MELRTIEETVLELSVWYESVRRSSVLQEHQKQQETVAICLPLIVLDEDQEKGVEVISDLATLSQTLTRLKTSLQTLEPKIARFRQRLQEKDAVTGKPRYGEKTQTRVQVLVDKCDILYQAIPIEHGEDQDKSSNRGLLLKLQQQHERQQEEAQQAQEEEEKLRLLLDEQKRLEREQRIKEEQRKALEEEERLARERSLEEEELHRQAILARQRRLAQEQAEQDWMGSIPKGPDGVRKQIHALKEATQGDPQAQVRALQSLMQIFQQINAHPEETKFRRIRKNHQQFNQDIGRHKGGVEILIAAGFVSGAIDDVPSYFSIEPDIEKDMDGWAKWFDSLKTTLEILEEEQPQHKR